MISVVIPTLDDERHLVRTLAALVPAAIDGVVREVIIADGGSRDATLRIADHAGAEVVAAPKGRAARLRAGAARARAPWLLFLRPDTILEPGWQEEVADFIERVDEGRRPPAAAVFRLRYDDEGFMPGALEQVVAIRTRLFRLPYGDQGLLISRALYSQVGGYAELPMMEDVDLVRRLGRRRIALLSSRARTSAERHKRDGSLARGLRRQACLWLYLMKVPPERIARLFDPERPAPRSAS